MEPMNDEAATAAAIADPDRQSALQALLQAQP
jgi:hypothetical protein